MSPTRPAPAIRLGRLLPALICAWMLVFQPAWTHEVWVDRVLLIHFGEPGEQLDPFSPDKVAEVRAFAASGEPAAVTVMRIGDTGAVIRPQGEDPAAVLVRWEGGFRVEQGEKWVAVPEAEALAAGTWRRSTFFSKAIVAWNARFAQPLGHEVEIVPLADPLALRAGGTLPARVLADGQPLPGVAVTLDDGSTLTSGDGGRIDVPIAAVGTRVVKAKVAAAAGQGAYTRWGVLSFRVVAPAAGAQVRP